MDSRPRVLAGRSDGVSSSSCPVVTVPARSVPVTVAAAAPDAERLVDPEPDRGGGIGGLGSAATSRSSASRRSGSPAPVTALTGTAGTVPRLVLEMWSSASRIACRVARLPGDGEQAVPDAHGVDGSQVLG